jgi:hypothetical protein
MKKAAASLEEMTCCFCKQQDILPTEKNTGNGAAFSGVSLKKVLLAFTS